jgi:stage V sporulation protein B
MCAIHGCIIGYFMGKRKTGIPALAQLMEQVCRVGSVFCIATVTLHQGYLSVNTAMAGLFAGEAASSLVCVLAVLYEYKKEKRNTLTPASVSKMRDRKLIFTMAYPLTLGRVITAVILSSEAVLILRGLKAYGLSHSESVRIYGILTGMSMPFIFFPSTITGAIASMILPSVSEAQSAGNYTKISKMTTLVVKYCFSIGIFFAALFYLYGLPIGTFFFHSQEAGVFISILSWLCPFMYLGATLTSILNGLGLTKITFFINIGTALSRVAAIALLVPVFGIKGYLWGLLASHILTAALLLGFVKKYTRFHYSLRQCLLTPCIITLLSIVPCRLILVFSNSSMISLGCPVLLSCALFAGLLYYNSAIHNRDF